MVVPTFKRPELLDRCLAALVAQTFDPSAYEIVIADDAASESTRRQVEEWRNRYLQRDRQFTICQCVIAQGPAAARNAGWRFGQGRVIAFTDDDCIPQPRMAARPASGHSRRGARRSRGGSSYRCLSGRPTTSATRRD